MHICCCTLPKQMRTMHARLPRILLEIPRFAKTLGTALFCLLCCFFSLLCCRFRCPCYSHRRNKMPVHIRNSKCETPADVQASASSEAKCRRLRHLLNGVVRAPPASLTQIICSSYFSSGVLAVPSRSLRSNPIFWRLALRVLATWPTGW